MKTRLILTGCVLAATLLSCQKQEVRTETPEGLKTIHFTAGEAVTRASFAEKDGSTYPARWNDGDRLYSATTKYNDYDWDHENTIHPTVSPDGRSINFDVTVRESGQSDTLCFFYPCDAVKYSITTHRDWMVKLPDEQVPTRVSPDPAAMLLLAQFPFTEAPEYAELEFRHVTAYGKLILKNFDPGDATVESVTISCDEEIVGGRMLFLSDATRYGIRYEAGDLEDYFKDGTINIRTDAAGDIWFSCFPADLSGNTLSVIVCTDKGSFTKTVTLPSGLTMQAGKVTTLRVDMAGIGLEPWPVTERQWLCDLYGEDEYLYDFGYSVPGTLIVPGPNTTRYTYFNEIKRTVAGPGVFRIFLVNDSYYYELKDISGSSATLSEVWPMEDYADGITYYYNDVTTAPARAVEEPEQLTFIGLRLEIDGVRYPVGTWDVPVMQAFLDIAAANGGMLPIVSIGGYGQPADYEGIDVRGKVALVKRGTIYFSEKQEAAASAGAAGILVYDNTPDGNLYLGSDIADCPMAGISLQAGTLLGGLSSVRVVEISEPDEFYYW